MNTTQLKEFVQLGQAAYAKFSESEDASDSLVSAPNGPFAEGEAKQFTDRYGVLDQYTDPGLSGFSATVFQDKDNPSRVVLSFRGTEFNGDKFRDLLLSDLQIGFDGYASPQAVPLYTYIKRLMTPAGQTVSYTEADMVKLYELSAGKLYDPKNSIEASDFALFKQNFQPGVGIDAGQTAGTAVLAPGKEIDVAGHSLGGHLALLAQRLFPGAFDDVVTVNAVTFYSTTAVKYSLPYYTSEKVLSQFGEWDGSKILRIESEGDAVSGLGSVHPGLTYTVSMETQPAGVGGTLANHSAANIADGFALIEAMGRLDGRFMADARLAKPFFDAGSNEPVSTYETLLDGLRQIIQGNAELVTTTNTGDEPASRQSFYDNLATLMASDTFKALEGKVTLSLSGSQLATAAKTDYGAFLSLSALSPIVLSVTDATALAALQAIDPESYSAWQADKNARLYGDTAKEFDYSDQWYADRAAMLAYVMQANTEDATGALSVAGAQGMHYQDQGSGQQIDIGLPDDTVAKRQTVFGDGQDNTLEGKKLDDHLYGGAGSIKHVTAGSSCLRQRFYRFGGSISLNSIKTITYNAATC